MRGGHAPGHRGLLVGITAAWLASCGGGGGGTPPQDVPASDAEAARFLTQATFGPTTESIAELKALGYTEWFRRQMDAPVSTQRPELEARALAGEILSQSQRLEEWWDNAVRGPDQLRQRLAFALSEIFVISDRAGALSGDVIGMAEYHDTLARFAFGRYRDLLERVTLSPQMGKYLSMLRNRKPDPTRNLRPDENYAREILQLFSIGLVQLEPDGTARRDGQGNEIPTYTQDTIVALAHVFTGWAYSGTTSFFTTPSAPAAYLPMAGFEAYHDTGAKTILDGVQVPAGGTTAADLRIALDTIAGHPNVGPFLARQLIQRLVTSNPSPAYVGRVAAVFADDGRGVRGNLGAVVQAILTDDEARTGHLAAPTTFGKLREPLLRQTAIWRAFRVAPQGSGFRDWNPETYFDQAPLRAPTVFNFFRPDFEPPGALDRLDLQGPEFQILTHTTAVRTTNRMRDLVISQVRGVSTSTTAPLIDLAREEALAADTGSLLAHLDLLLLSGQMSADLRDLITRALTGIPANRPRERAQAAIWLIVTSPHFAIQK